jgi:hypothetical protein
MCRLCRRYDHHLKLIRRGAVLYADPKQNRLKAVLPEVSKSRLKRILAEKTNLS